MVDFQKFPVAYGGHEYIAEFDNDTVMRCQSAGVFDLASKPLDFAFECFFWSLQKNHSGTSRRTIREFFDSVILDEDYGVDAFADISDEFVRLYSLLFTSKGKKKTFSAIPAPVIKIPKA